MELCRLTKARVYMPGGLMNRNSLSVVGHTVLDGMKPVNFDLAVLGATSYSYDIGFTCESAEDNAVKRFAASKSSRTVILMDSSKIGRRGSFTMCEPDQVTDIVMDDNVPDEFREMCLKYNITLH